MEFAKVGKRDGASGGVLTLIRAVRRRAGKGFGRACGMPLIRHNETW
jgi:hypothetical protein